MYNREVRCSLQIFLLIIMFTNGELTTFSSNLSSTESSSIETTTIISTETTTSNDNTTFQTTATNEETTVTAHIPFTSTEAMTTAPEFCGPDISNGINITDRTSTMFTARINYNCSSINSSELFVFVNETLANNCYITEDLFDNNTINVTCDPIENNAGRNWSFTIIRMNFRHQIILNETFLITFEPLSLNISTNISIEIHDDRTSSLVFIPNCLNITDREFLIFRCNSSDRSNNTLSNNCTYTCSNLEPGSIYNASLIRLAIPIVDTNDEIFEEESLYQIYITDLDKVTNLIFDETSTDKKTALIHFDRPRGYYDQIHLYCSAQDQHCSNGNIVLTNSTTNCSNCTSIFLSPITRGVLYKCQTITIKENFLNITSDDLMFDTPLESIVYEKSGQHWFSSSSHFVFNVTARSDFDYIQSFCIINENQTFPCSDSILVHQSCSTMLEHNGILGCNYQCYFVTKKFNYADKSSNNYSMDLFPPKPIVYISDEGSRFISIKWTFDEPVYVKYFELLLNQTQVGTVEKEISSYSYTKLLPNRVYKLRVNLISNHDILSDPIFVKTLQDVPDIPTNNDIKNKIIPLSTDIESKSEQYAIEIDLSLFSNQYGFVYFYQIYVRQDQNKNTSKLDSIGTYFDAMKNESLDYLALVIPISSFMKSTKRLIRIIIGNETFCKDNSNVSIPCNRKLKADKNYKIVVSGCAVPGCTSVLSQSFRTQKNPTGGSGSKAWVAIFPILIVLIIGSLGIWKRKKVKNFYDRNIKKSEKIAQPSIHFKSDGSLSLDHTIRDIRSKFLIEYINMTHEDEKAIYEEYKELENISPQYRQSNSEVNYAIYNRYSNISARGPWNRTAIRLTGRNRLHDYINANQIKSYDNKKQYIACQGPLKETSQDFWDMIVQYNISTIIMLTKTEERNPQNPSKFISKCSRYFPMNPGQVLMFNGIAVKVTDIEYYYDSDLEIRHIIITENQVEHRLVHYYFIGWPDYHVVEPRKLLDLIQTINKHRQKSFNSYERTTQIPSTPTVVHCSAGVGRTGTYIAVDTIIRLLDRPNGELPIMKLDVMGIVYQLRKDRGKMVQTKEQYMLINRCVEEYLKKTRRLNIILQRSNIYENVNTDSSTSSEHIYMNLRKPNNATSNRSTSIDSQPDYVNLAELRSLSDRSNTVGHETDDHRNRIHTAMRRSTYNPFNDNHYPSAGDDDSSDHILPPRRIRTTQTSTKVNNGTR